jgi:hypothetical protein
MKENHEVKLLTNPMLKDKINKKKLISKKDPNHKKKRIRTKSNIKTK